jgi:hypothetical protein
MKRPSLLAIRFFAAALALSPLRAQQSLSYKLAEFVLNGGGHPLQGVSLASTNYRMKLDAVGESPLARALQSTSIRAEAGFAAAYPPPGEVQNLLYSSRTTMSWHAERSAGSYNVYRDAVSALPGLGFGACFERTLATATTAEPNDPPSDSGWFYLATSENRLREEGSKGNRSSGAVRGNPQPCP